MLAVSINYGAFDYSRPSSFPAQQLPKAMETPKWYIKTDKFGKRWRSKDENILNKFIENENKKPFFAIDKYGEQWQHQDKKALDDFIKSR